MHILQNEVGRALKSLAQRQAPPEGAPLFDLVRDTLRGVEVDLFRVKRVTKGQFLAKWHRRGGTLTGETRFTLIEPPFVAAWN